MHLNKSHKYPRWESAMLHKWGGFLKSLSRLTVSNTSALELISEGTKYFALSSFFATSPSSIKNTLKWQFQLTLAPVLPAIAAGNCVLIKPSEVLIIAFFLISLLKRHTGEKTNNPGCSCDSWSNWQPCAQVPWPSHCQVSCFRHTMMRLLIDYHYFDND